MGTGYHLYQDQFKARTEELKAKHERDQKRAKQLREEGLSHAVIGERLGCSPSRVNELLKGLPWKAGKDSKTKKETKAAL